MHRLWASTGLKLRLMPCGPAEVCQRKRNGSPQLEGQFEVKLASGETVSCRTVFDVTKELLDSSYTPEQVAKLTWAPAEAIRADALATT